MIHISQLLLPDKIATAYHFPKDTSVPKLLDDLETEKRQEWGWPLRGAVIAIGEASGSTMKRNRIPAIIWSRVTKTRLSMLVSTKDGKREALTVVTTQVG